MHHYKKYTANSKYYNIDFTVYKHRIYGTIYFNNLINVSAIHIHSSMKGEPILIWLASSPEWNIHTSKLSNAPCCLKNVKECNLISPYKVPDTKNSSFIIYHFDHKININDSCKNKCEWYKYPLIVNTHGYNLEKGADLIESTIAIKDI